MNTGMKWRQLASELDRSIAARMSTGVNAINDNAALSPWQALDQKVGALTRHLFPYLHDEDRDEIKQEVLLALLESDGIRRVKAAEFPYASVHRVVHNKGCDLLRNRQRDVQTRSGVSILFETEASADPNAIDRTKEARIRILNRELSMLSPDDRELLMERFVDSKPIKTLAAERGLKYSTVATRLFRLVRKLRHNMQLDESE